MIIKQLLDASGLTVTGTIYKLITNSVVDSQPMMSAANSRQYVADFDIDVGNYYIQLKDSAGTVRADGFIKVDIDGYRLYRDESELRLDPLEIGLENSWELFGTRTLLDEYGNNHLKTGTASTTSTLTMVGEFIQFEDSVAGNISEAVNNGPGYDFSDGFTLAFDVFVATAQARRSILFSRAHSSAARSVQIELTATNNISFRYSIGDGSVTEQVISDNPIALDTVQTILVSYDGTDAVLSINGTEKTDNNPGVLNDPGDAYPLRFGFGDGWGSTNRYIGQMKRMRLWSRGLDATERAIAVAGWTPGRRYRYIGFLVATGQSRNQGNSADKSLLTLIAQDQQIASARGNLVAHATATDVKTRSFLTADPRNRENQASTVGFGIENGLAAGLPTGWAVINTAIGSTNIESWQPGQSSYDGALAEVNAAKADLVALGYTITDVALHHWQGSANASPSASVNFESLTKSFIEAARSDMGVEQVLLMQMSTSYESNYTDPASIKQANINIAAADSKVTLYTKNGMELGSDGNHPTADETYLVGVETGKVIGEIVAKSSSTSDYDQAALVAAVRADLERSGGVADAINVEVSKVPRANSPIDPSVGFTRTPNGLSAHAVDEIITPAS